MQPQFPEQSTHCVSLQVSHLPSPALSVRLFVTMDTVCLLCPVVGSGRHLRPPGTYRLAIEASELNSTLDFILTN